MAFSVESFRKAMKLDGARPNLFEARVQDIDGNYDQEFVFMCKAAQLPGTTMGVVEVPFFGRQVRFAGNRTFPEWTVTILNDENFRARNVFERWHRLLSENAANVRAPNKINTYSYARRAEVLHYGKAGNVIRKYVFHGLFPTDVTPIDLDWGNNDVIEEFTVTFAFQYWTLERAGGSVDGATVFNTQDGSGAA